MARLSINAVVEKRVSALFAIVFGVAFAYVGIGCLSGAMRPYFGLFLLAVGVLSFTAWWLNVQHFADTVEEVDGALLIRRRGVEELIPISDIAKVSESVEWKTRRVILYLRRPSKFGRRIEFLPRPNSPFGSPGGSDVGRALRERVAIAVTRGSATSHDAIAVQ